MTYKSNYLAHFGIKGQKWGVRRYQNEDGSLTPEGKERYLGDIYTQADRYNRTVDAANKGLAKINKEWDKRAPRRALTDEENVEYTRQVAEMLTKEYEKVLVKDLGKTIEETNGREWIKDAFGVNYLWEEVRRTEEVAKKNRKHK